MLFDPHAHERLIEDRWDPGRVCAAITDPDGHIWEIAQELPEAG